MQRWLIGDRFSRFNTIPTRDGRTDGRNCHTSIALWIAVLCWHEVKINEKRTQYKTDLRGNFPPYVYHTLVACVCTILVWTTLGVKKPIHLTFDHNFCKCRPIFHILSLTNFWVNCLCNYYRVFHTTLTVLLHYLAKTQARIHLRHSLLRASSMTVCCSPYYTSVIHCFISLTSRILF